MVGGDEEGAKVGRQRTPRRRGSINAAKRQRSENLQLKRVENWLLTLARAGSAGSVLPGAVHGDKQHVDRQRKICREGFPDSLRARGWLAVRSHSRIRLMTESERSYADILRAASAASLGGTAEEPHAAAEEDVFGTIEADIGRTFPGHSWLDTPEGHASLRNVLRAFAVFLPSVGYCQSMNFIAAMLLVVFRSRPTAEEDSFWTLAVLETVILPNYHQRDLIGCQADARSLFTHTQRLLPKLHAHMSNHGIVPEVAFLPWFLALFVNALPVKAVMRVWDILLSEGSSILLSVSIAVLKLSEKALLAADNAQSLQTAIRAAPARVGGNVDKLIQTATNKKLAGLDEKVRESHTADIQRERQEIEQRRQERILLRDEREREKRQRQKEAEEELTTWEPISPHEIGTDRQEAEEEEEEDDDDDDDVEQEAEVVEEADEGEDEEEQDNQGQVQAQEPEQVEQPRDMTQPAQLAAGPPLADEHPPAAVVVEVEAAAATAGGASASVCGGLSIPLTEEEVEQLRANLAAAAAELQADERGSSWVVVEQENAQPVADDPGSPQLDKLREWV
eukprot:COSAG02_NODE_4022_length_5891_cov_111.561119_7_plen_565_part_00